MEETGVTKSKRRKSVNSPEYRVFWHSLQVLYRFLAIHLHRENTFKNNTCKLKVVYKVTVVTTLSYETETAETIL